MKNQDEILQENINLMRNDPNLSENLKQLSDDEFYKVVERNTRRMCPICQSSIRQKLSSSEHFECQHCSSELFIDSADPCSHQEGEINKSVSIDDMMGEFMLVTLPKGMQICKQCGDVYPKNYSCCPALLIYALDLFEEYKKRKAEDIIIEFLQIHIDTLKTSIPYNILPKLNKKQLKILKEISVWIEMQDYLEIIIEEESPT